MYTLITLGASAIAWFLGSLICRQIKLRDHGWKVGLVFACVAMATCILIYQQPKYGIDLRGGVILNYEVDEAKTMESADVDDDGEPIDSVASGGQPAIDMKALIESLKRRINPSGVREMVIRQYGSNQVEIIIPDVSPSETQLIKDVIANTGFLEFRIVADQDRNARVWNAGELALAADNEQVRKARFVREGDEILAEWVLLGKEDTPPGEPVRYRVPTGDMLTRELVPGHLEVLVTVDSELKLEGKHLRSIRTGRDEQGQPSVEFDMTAEGSVLFGSLTSMNLPDKAADSYSKLAIVMDGVLWSAPRIQSRISTNGQISGRFTPEEVEFLVRTLRAGKLPAVLHPEPISENNISPLLGEDTIEKGKVAIAGSLIAVLVFMVLYYRFCGFVACFALGFNLLFLLALMVAMKAAFTLPGLAGIVLTVGMSVDANVLIFERIREELSRGAALRMAIRNGFERATTTIIDANVTTLITAVILYTIGTDQIKGFGVTLILGILISMFTAIFCARIAFEIAERKGFINRLSMSRIIGDTSFRFLSKGPMAAILSLLIIGVGIAGIAKRGATMLDIDFTGGTSVTCLLNEPVPIERVRERVKGIADDISVTQINPMDKAKDTVYKIDASLQDQEELKQKIELAMQNEAGKSFLTHRSMKVEAPVPLSPAPTDTSMFRIKPDTLWLSYASLTGIVAEQGTVDATTIQNESDTKTAQSEEPTKTDQDVVDEPNAAVNSQPLDVVPEESATTGKDAAADDFSSKPPATTASDSDSGYLCKTTLTFEEPINARTVLDLIKKSAERLETELPRIDANTEGWNGVNDESFDTWEVKFSSNPTETARIINELKSTVDGTPVWLSANRISGTVAGDMKWKAVTAILLSMFAIIVYVWIRFQHLTYGLAAVVALVHDVLVTVGAVALSYWLATAAGFLMVDPFKISLPIVAAILTVIGYSLNDTIVIFDRIREVKGKSPELTQQMIDTSINQTLSRTILTSLTTLIVVIILYFFGGEGIHGFSFALIVGVISGTYSTVFVACPALMWMTRFFGDKQRPSQKQPVAASAR